jgi:hypothetical protein
MASSMVSLSAWPATILVFGVAADDGERNGDSDTIIAHLIERHWVALDPGLNQRQRNLHAAVQQSG